MKVSLKVGVAVALIVSFLGILPILHLFMGGCVFEQGCGEYEELGLIGVLLASCAVGICSGWAVARIITIAAERLAKSAGTAPATKPASDSMATDASLVAGAARAAEEK